MSDSSSAELSLCPLPETESTTIPWSTNSEWQSTSATPRLRDTTPIAAPFSHQRLPSLAARAEVNSAHPVSVTTNSWPQCATISSGGWAHYGNAQERRPAFTCHNAEAAAVPSVLGQTATDPPSSSFLHHSMLSKSLKEEHHHCPDALVGERSREVTVPRLQGQTLDITACSVDAKIRASTVGSFPSRNAGSSSDGSPEGYGCGTVPNFSSEQSADRLLNPLRREGLCGSNDKESPQVVLTGGCAVVPENKRTSSQATSHSAATSVCSNFSLSRIDTPRTADEYEACVAAVAHVRCGLGQELEGDAKDVYGPTWPFSRRLLASKVVGTRECPAPNCDHKTNIQAVTGPRIWSLPLVYGCLIAYPLFTTLAYVGEHGWQGIIFLWLLSAVTIFFLTLCAFTNPGIVPRRQLRNVKECGDVLIVRVPAPNAKAVLEKLQEMPETMVPSPMAKGGSNAAVNVTVEAPAYTGETVRSAVADGDIPASVFNHRRSVIYSMLRYFETDTGRILSYDPPLNESELAVPTLEFPILFCRTCRVAKGPRTHHCKVCDCCVDEMDHHCPWTNSCIGRNNYPFFFATLFFLHVTVLYAIAYNFALNLRFIYLHPTWSISQLVRYTYGMPILVYSCFFLFGLFFFPLMIGHVYMTCKGLTTTEMLKKRWKTSQYFCGINPWSQKHWYENVYSRLFKQWPAAPDDPLRWLDSRYYYGVTVAAALEDQKVDWLLALPPEERSKVDRRNAVAQETGAKVREEQEATIVRGALRCNLDVA